MLAGESLEHFKMLFQSEYASANKPREMALFIRHESEGRLHCEVKVYFSPATITIAKTVGAIVCKKPSPLGLGLLAGSEESWSVLFPGYVASSTC